MIKVEKNHIQEHGIKNCDHFQEISPFLTAITKGKQEPLEIWTDIAQKTLSSIWVLNYLNVSHVVTTMPKSDIWR